MRAHRSAFLAFVLSVVSLAFCEGFVRAYRSLATGDLRAWGYPEGLYIADDRLEYALRPGFQGAFTNTGSASIPLAINSLGYRNAPFEVSKPPGVARIAFLGDSVVFGSGVRARHRFSDLIDANLRRSRRGEVINLAVNSYTFFHYREQVNRDIPALDVDAVVIGFCLNDIARKEGSGPRRLVDRDLPDASLRERAARASALVWLALELLAGAENASDGFLWDKERAWAKWMERVMAAWEDPELLAELEGDLRMVRDELARAQRPLLVLIPPEVHDLVDPAGYGEPRRRLNSLLDRLQIDTLDLHASFQDHLSTHPIEATEYFLPGDAVHLTPLGHELLAQAALPRVASLLSRSIAPVGSARH